MPHAILSDISFESIPALIQHSLGQSLTQIITAGLSASWIFAILLLSSFIIGFSLAGFIFYFFWQKRIQKHHQNISKQIKQVQKDTAIRTAQSLTSFFTHEIGSQNNQIREWIYRKQSKGEQVPVKVQQANHNISQSLVNLSRLSFEMPYLQDNPVSAKSQPVKKISNQSA